MIIDAWMQHPNAEWIRNPMFDSLRRWKPGKWSETSRPIEATVAEMDQAGVSLGMLCAWHGPSGPMIGNDEVAHHCRTHPGRFAGIASVDLHRPMDGVRELRRRVKQAGFKGLRVLPWVWGLPPDDRRTIPVCRMCEPTFRSARKSDMPDRSGNRNRAPIPYLDRVALEFPELRIVGGHIGAPGLAMPPPRHGIPMSSSIHRPTRSAAIPKSCSTTCRAMRGTASCWVNDRFWPPGECIAGLNALELGEASKAAFLAANAQRGFKLE